MGRIQSQEKEKAALVTEFLNKSSSLNLLCFFCFLGFFWLRWVFIAARAFSSCGERGLLFVAARGLLIAVASLVAEPEL